MQLPTINRVFKHIESKLKSHPDRFLRKVSGVIHVGANVGQERGLYDRFGLRVLWIEPIPEIFETLKGNLSDFPNQRAIQCLVTDRDNEEYQFHVASNRGASSSILDFKAHTEIWPEVTFTNTITLRSTTLASLLERERIPLSDYQALVMDTQGSELLVLQGSVPLLHGFKFIKTEVPDFESYAGCCQLTEISNFMGEHGFKEYARHQLASRPRGGNYYDVIYQRNN